MTQNLVQHVSTPAHIHGHMLDLVITRDDLPVMVPPTDLPLSDHAFITADFNYGTQPMIMYPPTGELYGAGSHSTLMH